jgi:hypothetical protein
MQPWRVSITHCCVAWSESWSADVRRAFAALGWTVTSLGAAGSSTHVEEDYLNLTSDRAAFDQAVLADVLSELGVFQGEYEYRDGGESHRRAWRAVIDGAWWDRCTDPRALVEAVKPLGPAASGQVTDRYRKFWLCACAASRYCPWEFKGRAEPVFNVLERFADGTASEQELRAARDTHLANDPADPWPYFSPNWPYPYPFDDYPGDSSVPFWQNRQPPSFACAIVCAALDELRAASVRRSDSTGWDSPAFDRRSAAARAKLVGVVRDIFGNPFQLIYVDPTWLRRHDGAMVHMAKAIYDHRRFQDLPILADALAEAGCTDPVILGHCRGQGEHVRGCWVVDLILGKA